MFCDRNLDLLPSNELIFDNSVSIVKLIEFVDIIICILEMLCSNEINIAFFCLYPQNSKNNCYRFKTTSFLNKFQFFTILFNNKNCQTQPPQTPAKSKSKSGVTTVSTTTPENTTTKTRNTVRST